MTAKFKLKLWPAISNVGGPLIDYVPELRGLDLVCWCKPYACHGDLLLGLANASTASKATTRGESTKKKHQGNCSFRRTGRT